MEAEQSGPLPAGLPDPPSAPPEPDVVVNLVSDSDDEHADAAHEVLTSGPAPRGGTLQTTSSQPPAYTFSQVLSQPQLQIQLPLPPATSEQDPLSQHTPSPDPVSQAQPQLNFDIAPQAPPPPPPGNPPSSSNSPPPPSNSPPPPSSSPPPLPLDLDEDPKLVISDDDLDRQLGPESPHLHLSPVTPRASQTLRLAELGGPASQLGFAARPGGAHRITSEAPMVPDVVDTVSPMSAARHAPHGSFEARRPARSDINRYLRDRESDEGSGSESQREEAEARNALEAELAETPRRQKRTANIVEWSDDEDVEEVFAATPANPVGSQRSPGLRRLQRQESDDDYDLDSVGDLDLPDESDTQPIRRRSARVAPQNGPPPPGAAVKAAARPRRGVRKTIAEDSNESSEESDVESEVEGGRRPRRSRRRRSGRLSGTKDIDDADSVSERRRSNRSSRTRNVDEEEEEVAGPTRRSKRRRSNRTSRDKDASEEDEVDAGRTRRSKQSKETGVRSRRNKRTTKEMERLSRQIVATPPSSPEPTRRRRNRTPRRSQRLAPQPASDENEDEETGEVAIAGVAISDESPDGVRPAQPRRKRKRVEQVASDDDGDIDAVDQAEWQQRMERTLAEKQKKMVREERRKKAERKRKAAEERRNRRRGESLDDDGFIVSDGSVVESEESEEDSPPPKRRRRRRRRGSSSNNSSDSSELRSRSPLSLSGDSSVDSEDVRRKPITRLEKERAADVFDALKGRKLPPQLQLPIVCVICRQFGRPALGTQGNGWRDGYIQPLLNFSGAVQKGNYGMRMTAPFCLAHTAGDQNKYVRQLEERTTRPVGEAREALVGPGDGQGNISESSEDPAEMSHSEGFNERHEEVGGSSDEEFINRSDADIVVVDDD